MRSTYAAAPLVPLLVCLCVGRALASPCAGTLSRAEVVRCALAASLDVKQARLELQALSGRRIQAGLWLPANPVLSGTLEGRVGGADSPLSGRAPEWQVTLSQEVELAGQRGARVDAVDAEAEAQRRRVKAAEQEVAAAALRSYFELLASKSALALADELTTSTATLARFAEERAHQSLIAPLDAHLIRAEAVRVGLVRAGLLRQRAAARAALAALLGEDPAGVELADDAGMPVPPVAEASLPALPALIERALAARGDLAAAQVERRVADRQLALFKRSRVPNLTFSIFTTRDVLDEQELGGGLSVPLPLPAPVGHSQAGPIAEARARKEQAQVTVEQVRRQVRREVTTALADEQSRALALRQYPADLIAQAPHDLQALRDGLASGQLSVREALLAERTLIELLLGHVDTQLNYALAQVELERAISALPVEARP